MRRLHRLFWPALGLVLLYFTGLTRVGLLGPDEPRYAAIAREMARSGDWITPRLWGEPWFEKPPLTYWMIGVAFRVGLGEDLAPRLPAALLSVAFLIFYYLALRREFGHPAALNAALILGSTAGWLAFARVGVTDLPLSATFSAAMLLALPWLARGDRRRLPAAALLLGLAVLAKGLVPLVLALPLLIMGRRRWRDWLRLAPLSAFLLAAAPWYVAMSLRHGAAFLHEFFLRHHFARLYADELQHVQPLWFYLPVLAAGLYPWTPLAALLARRQWWADQRVRFFGLWALFGLVFFSLSVNKLPGYLLPLLPAVCALLGLALAEHANPRWALAVCGGLLALIPVGAEMLPAALLVGIRRAPWVAGGWGWLALASATALWCWWWAPRRKILASGAIAAGVAAGVLLLELKTFPVLDEQVSVRAFWRRTQPSANQVCLDQVDRERRYGLSYYAGRVLPDCGSAPRSLLVRQAGDGRLQLIRR